MDSQNEALFRDNVSRPEVFPLGVGNPGNQGNPGVPSSWWNASTEAAHASEQPLDTTSCNYGLFKFTLYACVMGTVCFVGFCGNITSFVVLRKDGSSPTASLQLQALAVADNFLLLFWTNHFILGYLFEYIGIRWVDLPRWLWYIRVYAFPMLFIGQTETIWLTVMIAVNRYIVVRIPLKARLLCTARRIRIQVVAVTVFSILYNLPRFFDIAVASQFQPQNLDSTQNLTSNETWNNNNNTSTNSSSSSSSNSSSREGSADSPQYESIYRYTDLGLNSAYLFIYGDIMYQIVTFALPLALLAFFNTSVMFAYYTAFKRRQRMVGGTVTRHEHNENNLTLLMIVVVLLFMVCQAPARVVQQVWSYRTKGCSPENYIEHFSSTLEAINSSVNFVVYFTFRKRFRRILQRSCCCRQQSDERRRLTSECSSATFYNRVSKANLFSNDGVSDLSHNNSSRVDSFNHHPPHASQTTTATALEDDDDDDADDEEDGEMEDVELVEKDEETTRLNQTEV